MTGGYSTVHIVPVITNLTNLFFYIPGCPIKGQQFNRCGSACPPTCTNRNPICTLQCVPRCQCPRGKVIDKRRKKCVFPSQCSHWTNSVLISDINIHACVYDCKFDWKNCCLVTLSVYIWLSFVPGQLPPAFLIAFCTWKPVEEALN